MKQAAIGLAISTGMLFAVVGCGGASSSGNGAGPGSSSPEKGAENGAARAGGMRATVDPSPYLALEAPAATRTWVKARSARLDVGDAAAMPDSEGEPVEVMIVEPGPTLVRVVWRGATARFAVWVERRDLFNVMKRDVPIRVELVPPTANVGGVLRQGAPVEILERGAERSKVRYSGAVELETWVPNEALSSDGEPIDRGLVNPNGKLFHAAPGMAIRAEPRWGSPLVAALARTYFLSEVRQLDDAWSEVDYSDRAVTVRGYASRRDPPVKLSARAPASQPSPSSASGIETNEKLPSGVCLYARERGELVGVSNDVVVAAQRGGHEGWWTVTLDTPWGPMQFAAERAGTSAGSWKSCEPTK